MSRNTDERILEEAKADVRRKLAKEEANWLATRIGLAAVEYPQIIRESLRFVFAGEFELLDARLKEQRDMIEQLRARLDKAGQLVKAIDERTRPRAAQPQRR